MNVLGMILVAAATVFLIYWVQHRRWGTEWINPSHRMPVSVAIGIFGLYFVLSFLAAAVQ